MNPIIKELAEEAGFCFWEDESWGPGKGLIDWGAAYDKEFDKYTELLIKDIIDRLYPVEWMTTLQKVTFENKLKGYYGIER